MISSIHQKIFLISVWIGWKNELEIDLERGQAGYLLGLVFCVREMAGSSATGWRGSWGLSMVRQTAAGPGSSRQAGL